MCEGVGAVFFRYIFIQLLSPYALGVALLTFIVSVNTIYQLINLLIAKGNGLSILWLVLYRMPQFLASTLPLAVVIAVIVVMARLSLDLEITAMQASGMGVKTLIAPVFTFGVLVTALTYCLTLWAQPAGYAAFETEKFRLLKSQTTQQIQPQVIHPNFNGKILYVDAKGAEELLKGVFIADQTLSQESMVIMANEGRFDFNEADQEVQLKLFAGTIHLTPDAPEGYRLVKFDTLNYDFAEPTRLAEGTHIWGTPTLELLSMQDDPDAMQELLLRLTSPLAAFVFALVCLPLGITDPRSGRSGSYLRGLLLVAVYYILWLGAKNMEFQGQPILHLLWLPPLLILFFGRYFLYKTDHNLKNFTKTFQHFWWKKKRSFQKERSIFQNQKNTILIKEILETRIGNTFLGDPLLGDPVYSDRVLTPRSRGIQKIS